MSSDSQSKKMADKLAEGLEGVFESVALTRRKHFEDNPNKRPNKHEIESICSYYGNCNAAIAGAANMVPGIWGALVIVPELVAIIRNQIQMIYDIGVASGKEANLNSHLLLAIFATIMGGGTIGIVTVKGSQVLVKRASLRVIQKIIEWLGGKITQKLLKQFLAKWIPVVGAAAMAAWARQSTISMGRKAAELLEKDIVFSDEEFNESDIPA